MGFGFFRKLFVNKEKEKYNLEENSLNINVEDKSFTPTVEWNELFNINKKNSKEKSKTILKDIKEFLLKNPDFDVNIPFEHELKEKEYFSHNAIMKINFNDNFNLDKQQKWNILMLLVKYNLNLNYLVPINDGDTKFAISTFLMMNRTTKQLIYLIEKHGLDIKNGDYSILDSKKNDLQDLKKDYSELMNEFSEVKKFFHYVNSI